VSDPHALEPFDDDLDALAEELEEETPLPRRRREPLGPSPRLRGVALALGAVLGFIGAHRFYVGKTGTAFAQLFTFGGFGLWWLYDVILIVAGEFTDAKGRPLLRWNRSDEPIWGGGESRRVGLLTREVEALRAQVSELAERVDFTERLLSRKRE
jgi:hypothetical protein